MMYCTLCGGVEKVGGHSEESSAGDAAAGSGADVDQAASVAQAARHHVDDQSDLGQRLLDRGGNLRVFVVDDAGDFEGGFGVEAHRGFVGTFRRKIVQVLRLIVIRLLCRCLSPCEKYWLWPCWFTQLPLNYMILSLSDKTLL